MVQQSSEEGRASEVEPVTAAEEDVDTLRQVLAEEKTKAESYLASWQRAQADFINYKRRAEQEKEEIGKFANAMLMTGLLPVIDDLERAFAAIPARLAKMSWIDGIRLIERKLEASLETQGLSPIKALGEPFDPNLHEAVMHGKGKEGMVVQELQKGYRLHERVIRPAMVVIGNGEETEEKEEKET